MGSIIHIFISNTHQHTHEIKRLKQQIHRLCKINKRLIRQNSRLIIKNERFKLIDKCKCEPTWEEYKEITQYM